MNEIPSKDTILTYGAATRLVITTVILSLNEVNELEMLRDLCSSRIETIKEQEVAIEANP